MTCQVETYDLSTLLLLLVDGLSKACVSAFNLPCLSTYSQAEANPRDRLGNNNVWCDEIDEGDCDDSKSRRPVTVLDEKLV